MKRASLTGFCQNVATAAADVFVQPKLHTTAFQRHFDVMNEHAAVTLLHYKPVTMHADFNNVEALAVASALS